MTSPRLLCCAAVLWIAGCAATPPSAASRPNGGPGTQSAANAGGAGYTAQSGDPGLATDNQPGVVTVTKPPAAGSDDADDAGDVCKAQSAAAQQVPVDVYMMIDQSLSMVSPDDGGNSRWDDVIGALTQFINAPESAGLNVGVQYFGLGLAGSSCEPNDYAMPEVEIGELPGNAKMLTDSFAAHGPSSVTPTLPALQGAIQHAQAYKMAHPSHSVVVLLVTDGEPDLCGTDLLGDTVHAASAGLAATPSIATYVLGVGSSLDNLNMIAKAGGTEQAYIVDGTSNVSAQVVAALNKIRGSAALPCEFQIPQADPGMQFDFDKVNLTYTPTSGSATTIGYAADPSACGSAQLAWHYDDPHAPTKIELCDATCKAVASGGQIAIALHCPTVPIVVN